MTMFVENPAFLEELEHSIEAQAVLHEAAIRVAAEITAASPTKKITFHADGTKAVTDSSIWHIVNYGSINNSPYRYIEHGVARAGLSYRDLHT